jgi:copper chaperone NosL
MTISQNQWGAEIVTDKAKILKFDAIECMAKYINDGLIKHDDIHSCWTVAYDNPGQLSDVDNSYFLHARSLPSPMAMFLTGFSAKSARDKTMNQHPGDALDWKGVLAIVKEEWGD